MFVMVVVFGRRHLSSACVCVGSPLVVSSHLTPVVCIVWYICSRFHAIPCVCRSGVLSVFVHCGMQRVPIVHVFCLVAAHSVARVVPDLREAYSIFMTFLFALNSV